MSGLTGLVDTLLAAKLSQRLDLLGLKSAAVVAGPGPAVAVEAVGNDVRLLSHAAVDRQMGAATTATPAMPAMPAMPAASRAAVEGAAGALLSPAGRAISTVLTDMPAEAGPVRGRAALWPSMPQSPAGPLARALANTVSTSGVFYESHLLAFDRGLMTRSQLQQEPQAAWAAPGAKAAAPAASPHALLAPPATEANSPAPAPAAPAQSAAAGVIHPQAVTLVHQQLDLLASGAFRWSGEAWPGVPMDWSIQEEPPDRHPDPLEPESPARWATTLSLMLPRLGAIDVRLVLAGTSVKAKLEAGVAVVARLRAEAGELEQRLSSAGFTLPDLAIASRDMS